MMSRRLLLLALFALMPSAVADAAVRDPFSHLFTVPRIAVPGDAVDDRQHLAAVVPAPRPFAPTAIHAALAAQDEPPPPPPARTGVGALFAETGKDFATFPRRRSTWMLLGLGAGAAALAHPVDTEVNQHIVGSNAVRRAFAPGKYLGSFYVQSGVATGLYVVGRYVLPPAEGEDPTNKLSHLGFDMIRALVVSQAMTQGIKIAVRRDRPTGECCSFPSGHASSAFATAAVLERHLGYRGAWPTFVVASYVAASRLHDGRHYLSDVLFGSALGIASGWTVVGRHGRSKYTLMPTPVRGGMMVALTKVQPAP